MQRSLAPFARGATGVGARATPRSGAPLEPPVASAPSVASGCPSARGPAPLVEEPTVSGAQTGSPVRPSGELTTLTNVEAEIAAADVLPQYVPGSGFSGVYNPATGQWVAKASGDASLVSGQPIRTVPRRGGHAPAEANLMARIGITDTSGNVGFVLLREEGNILRIRWNSGQINLRNFGNSAAPLEYRAAIRESIQRETGWEVRE